MFISRFPNGSMISSDFKSLEVYYQADLSHDKQLVADLRAGLDMHAARFSTGEQTLCRSALACEGGQAQGN